MAGMTRAASRERRPNCLVSLALAQAKMEVEGYKDGTVSFEINEDAQ